MQLSYYHADTFTALIEKHVVHQSPRRIDELVKIFIHATKVSFKGSKQLTDTDIDTIQMETGFWDMAGAA